MLQVTNLSEPEFLVLCGKACEPGRAWQPLGTLGGSDADTHLSLRPPPSLSTDQIPGGF